MFFWLVKCDWKLVNLTGENAFYLFRTMESNLLSPKCFDDIVEGTTHLVRNTLDSIKNKLKECLDEARIKLDEVPGFEGISSTQNPIYNPFWSMCRPNLKKLYSSNKILD